MSDAESHGLNSVSASIDLAYPFTGCWLVQNSPANGVPRHGTHAFATAYAIDFVPVSDSGRTAPITLSSLVRPEPADRFPGFGRPILVPVEGVVVAVNDTEPDHPAYRGLPSIRYALIQHRRAASGWVALAGNTYGLETRSGVAATPATAPSLTFTSRRSTASTSHAPTPFA